MGKWLIGLWLFVILLTDCHITLSSFYFLFNIGMITFGLMKALKTPLFVAGMVYLLCSVVMFFAVPKGVYPEAAVLFLMVTTVCVLADMLLRSVKDRRKRAVFNWVVSAPFIALFILVVIFNFILPNP